MAGTPVVVSQYAPPIAEVLSLPLGRRRPATMTPPSEAAGSVTFAAEDEAAAARSPHPPHRGQCAWGLHRQTIGWGTRVETVGCDSGVGVSLRRRRRPGAHLLQNSIACRMEQSTQNSATEDKDKFKNS